MTATDFRSFSRSIVKDFLQTVVVLDDRAKFTISDDPVSVVIEPDVNGPITADEATNGELSAPPSTRADESRHDLDARTLIDSFAKSGLVCAVLRPEGAEKLVIETLAASKRADIVILDWQIEDNGETATKIIEELLKNDGGPTRRLRLISIYTAQNDLESAREKVSEALKDFNKIDQLGDLALALQSAQCRIVFLQKGDTWTRGKVVPERNVADQLIDEFVELSKGLVPNAALRSIAAIRDETHRVLARFTRNLDGPLLTHRLMLDTPQDAEAFAIDLITSEFQSILQMRGLGAECLGSVPIGLALKEMQKNGHNFRLHNQKGTTVDSLTADEFSELLNSSPENWPQSENVKIKGIGKKHLNRRTYQLLHVEADSGKRAHYEFARVSALAREAPCEEIGWVPKLELGTIIRDDKRYLICIQPICDAVRLTECSDFIFIPAIVDANNFDLVLQVNGNPVLLKCSRRASSVVRIAFQPDAASRAVIASKLDGKIVFTPCNEMPLEWVANLRLPFAMRIASRIATDLSRVGLDEFEWVRERSRDN